MVILFQNIKKIIEDFYDEVDREYGLTMDGFEHNCPTHITGCCKNVGRQCNFKDCFGWMHYQPTYAGYHYHCEVCGTIDI